MSTSATYASTQEGSWIMKISYCTRKVLLAAAFCLGILPSVLKMYETSHWFREGDPSVYDNTKEWFENPKLPFQKQVDDPKTMMRIYFFILPYIFMTMALVLAHLLPKQIPRPAGTIPPKPKVQLMGRSFLLRTTTFPSYLVRIGAPMKVSVGEVLGVLVFLFLNFGTIGVRIRRSLPRGSRKNLFLVEDGDAGKEEIDGLSWEATEVWAKTFGVISILNLGWYLLMPIGKRSVLLEAIGLSWDRAIKYHRWCGYYSVAVMFVHGMLFIAVLIHGNGHPVYDPEGVMLKQNLVAWGCREDCDDEQRQQLRVNIYGIITLILVLTMTIFALPYFRRFKFEWFYYAHHLFILVLFFICLHYSGALIYLIPGVAIYTIDKLMGLLAYLKTGLAKTKMVGSDVLELSMKLGPDVKYKAGQYVFVNVPSVSYLEWHPYSLTASPNAHPGELFFHLKATGAHGSWTRKVIKAAIRDENLPIRIDGFYGDYSHELQDKNAVVVVGGGIGVTPMMSIALDLVTTDPTLPVTLMWICRTINEFEIFSAQLHNAARRYPNLAVKVWITLSLPEPTKKLHCKIKKSIVQDLPPEEACDLVVNLLKDPAQEKRNAHFNSSAFVMDQHGLNALSNATTMVVAMVLALTGYTTSVDISNQRDVVPEEKFVMMSQSIIMSLVVGTFVVVCLLRPILKVVKMKKGDSDSPTTTPIKADAKVEESARTVQEDSSRYVKAEEDSSTSDDVEGASVASTDSDIFKSILQGRIGCRPDMEAEFQDMSKNIAGQMKDIGVLACGPQGMTRAINKAVGNECHLVDCFSNKAKTDDDGVGDTYFAFVEEDWEW